MSYLPHRLEDPEVKDLDFMHNDHCVTCVGVTLPCFDVTLPWCSGDSQIETLRRKGPWLAGWRVELNQAWVEGAA